MQKITKLLRCLDLSIKYQTLFQNGLIFEGVEKEKKRTEEKNLLSLTHVAT